MRRLIGPAAATAAALVQPAAAQMPPRAMAPSEVALHVVAHGETTTPADRIAVTATIAGKGPSAAEAEAAAQATADRVVAALVAAGIERSQIVTAPPSAGVVVTVPPVVIAPPPPLAGAAAVPPGSRPIPVPVRTANVAMTVTVSDQAGLDRVRRTLAAQGQSPTGKPAASLRDPAPARRAAAAAALARARSDAEDYAAALGMRVARVVAVSNAAGLGDGIEEIADLVERYGNRDAAADKVVTRATATVDYALTPGR